MNAKQTAKDLWDAGYFRRSKRQYQLFEFLLDNSLSDNPRELDQYIIATEVLGRSEDFDPYNDSIVRSEVSRLRKSLAVYNAKQSTHNFIIPSRSFSLEVIQIENDDIVVTHKEVKEKRVFSWPHVAALALIGLFVVWLVQHFNTSTTTDRLAVNCSHVQPNFGLVFDTQSLGEDSYVESLVRSTVRQYTNINIVTDARICTGNAPAYNLNLTSKMFGSNDFVLLELVDENTSKQVHFKRIDLNKNNTNDQDEFNIAIYKHISALLNQTGTFARHVNTSPWSKTPLGQNYKCVTDFYDYLNGDPNFPLSKVTHCLERAAEHKDVTLDTLGALLQAYYLQERQDHAETSQSDKLSYKIDSLVTRIGDQWINSLETTISNSVISRRDTSSPDINIADIELSLQHYPDSWAILTISAAKYGYYLGKWEKALEIDLISQKIDPYDDSYTHYIRAGYALVNESPPRAIQTCKKHYKQSKVITILQVNACAHRANDKDWIDLTEKRLAELGYADIQSRIDFIRNINYEPKITQIMIDAWRGITP